MNYKDDINYMEGRWIGKGIADRVDRTDYKDLETAIKVKQNLVDNFEKKFGYSHNQDSFDRNYTFNLGVLEVLKERFKEQNKDE